MDPKLEQIWDDPDFHSLPENERIKVLKYIDPDYSKMPEMEQRKVAQKSGSWLEERKRIFEERNRKLQEVSPELFDITIRPASETIGLIAGGMLGSGSGPLGSAAGGSGGYALGAGVADRLEELLGYKEVETFLGATESTVENIRKGAEYEVGGQVVGKAVPATIGYLVEKSGLKGLFSKIRKLFPNLSDRGIMLKAKEILSEVRNQTPEMQKNLKESEALLKRRGVKTTPTYAQKTGGYEAAALEQHTASKNAEIAAILKNADAEINKEVLESVGKEFRGSNIEDMISGVSVEHAKRTNIARRAVEASDKVVAPLRMGQTTQDVGRGIKMTLEEAKAAEKNVIDSMYRKIPEGIEVSASNIQNGVKIVTEDFRRIGGGSQSVPKDIIRQINAAVKDGQGKISFARLKDLRSQISEEIRESMMGQNPNLKLTRRLKIIESAIDQNMDEMLKLGDKYTDTVIAYREANAAFKKYVQSFRKGTVGAVLQEGYQAEGGKVPLSDIPSRFFSSGKADAADDLVRALGKDRASQVIDDFVGNDLLSRASENGVLSTKRANNWLSSNKDVLKKYGLFEKYSDIIKTKSITDEAIASLDSYNKTIASKVLGVDVDDIIRNIFSGASSKRSASIANELLNMPGIKNNPSAIKGVQVGFKDFIFRNMESGGAVDIAGNPVMSLASARKVLYEYGPAMQVIYKDAPEKMVAINDYHKMLQMLQRNKHVTFAGGSTTAEKITPVGELKTIGTNLAQYMAVSAQKGWKFSVLKNLWKSFFSGPRRYSDQQIRALLDRAVYDPDVARTIMSATRTTSLKDIKLMQQTYDNILIKMGLYATQENE